MTRWTKALSVGLLATGLGCLGPQDTTAPMLTPLTITTTVLPAGTVGAVYAATVRASGGSGGYVWSVIDGELPAGLSLGSANGAITGTPTASGERTFMIQVRSLDNQNATRELTINVSPA